MASYLISCWNGDQCEISLCSGENPDIRVALKDIKANLAAFYNKEFYHDKDIELRLYVIPERWQISETFHGWHPSVKKEEYGTQGYLQCPKCGHNAWMADQTKSEPLMKCHCVACDTKYLRIYGVEE
jgi:hypothetical protein